MDDYLLEYHDALNPSPFRYYFFRATDDKTAEREAHAIVKFLQEGTPQMEGQLYKKVRQAMSTENQK